MQVNCCLDDNFQQSIARLHALQEITISQERRDKGEKSTLILKKGKRKKVAKKLHHQKLLYEQWKENIANFEVKQQTKSSLAPPIANCPEL